MNAVISHFHSWEQVPDPELPGFLEEFAANGIRALSLSSGAAIRLLEDSAYGALLRRACRRNGLGFLNSHSPHLPGWELNGFDETILKRHLRLLEFYAEFGCQTVTVHAGTNDSGESLVILRERTNRSLAALIRRARELGLVIALENTIFPTDTPEELLGYASRFRCDGFGFCFDAGHANLMDGFPGKTSAQMIEWIDRRWNGHVRFQEDTLAMLLPDIVTCHLHDNDGFDDQHRMPGEGTIDWPRLLARLENAPRLISCQDEVNHTRYRVTVPEMAECFRSLLSEPVIIR